MFTTKFDGTVFTFFSHKRLDFQHSIHEYWAAHHVVSRILNPKFYTLMNSWPISSYDTKNNFNLAFLSGYLFNTHCASKRKKENHQFQVLISQITLSYPNMTISYKFWLHISILVQIWLIESCSFYPKLSKNSIFT